MLDVDCLLDEMGRLLCELMRVLFCMVHFSVECIAREFVVTKPHTPALLGGCFVAWVCIALL